MFGLVVDAYVLTYVAHCEAVAEMVMEGEHPHIAMQKANTAFPIALIASIGLLVYMRHIKKPEIQEVDV